VSLEHADFWHGDVLSSIVTLYPPPLAHQHAGAPLFHVSVLYELAPVGPNDGGFACLPGSHLDGATVGPPGQEKPVVHEINTEGIVPQPTSWGDWTPAGQRKNIQFDATKVHIVFPSE
jgi:hypothetical protein